ncbi:MAG: hypothetical protein WAM04_18170 [Candidatus Sulfotelmatobacter sp.]
MTIRIRAGLTLIVAVAIMGWAGCDHYNCSSGPNLGSGCTAGTGGLSTGGTGTSGGNSIAVLAYYVSNNEVGSVELNTTPALIDTPNFVLQTLPTGYTNSAIVTAQEQYLYMPYASTSSSASIYAWSIDGTTGALTALAGSPFPVPDAAGLASSDQPTTPLITNSAGTCLYMADALNSRIDVFQIDSSSGIPTAVPGSPFSTTIPPWNLAMDGLGRYLYATQGNYAGEGVKLEVFTINSATGALSNGTTMPSLNMWQLQGEPTGTFMIGVDGLTGLTGDNKPADPNIYVFSINSGGVLAQVGKIPTTSGNGPTAVVISPNGQFVYDFSLSISTGLDGPLDGYSLASGTLTPLAGSPFSALSLPDGGHFDQSGSYLFFHAASAIGAYDIDPSTGIPTEPTSAVGIGQGAVIYPWAVTDPK